MGEGLDLQRGDMGKGGGGEGFTLLCPVVEVAEGAVGGISQRIVAFERQVNLMKGLTRKRKRREGGRRLRILLL